MIAFGSIGSSASGTTSLSIPMPSGINAGDLLACGFVHRGAAVNAPSGWIAYVSSNFTGGAGAGGEDSGNILVQTFIRIADGSESANLSITGLTNTAIGVIARYTKDSGKEWNILFGAGSDLTAGTAWSVTSSPLSFIDDDFLIAISGINTDNRTFASQAASLSGVTFGSASERFDGGTNNGNDCGLVITDHSVTGESSGPVVYTMTASGTAGNEPAGATLLLRLREVDPIDDEFFQSTTVEDSDVEMKELKGLFSSTMEYDNSGVGVFVTDFRGRPLSGAVVVVANPDTTNPQQGATDSNGNVVLDFDGSNPNPVTVTFGKVSKTVNYTGGDSITIILENTYPME